MIKIQVVLTEKMHVYRERSNPAPTFGSAPLMPNAFQSTPSYSEGIQTQKPQNYYFFRTNFAYLFNV